MKDKTTKRGIVPRPADSGYCAGTTENPRWNEGLKGHDKNDVVEIAPSPAVEDRIHSQPSMGLARKKSDAHGHSGDHKVVRGRPYEYQEGNDAVAKPVSRELVNKQLGTSRRLGN